MRGLFLVAAVVASLPNFAVSERLSAKQLHQICNIDYDRRPEARIACEGFTMGVVEGIPRGAFMAIKNATPSKTTMEIVEEMPSSLKFCIPAKQTRGDVTEAIRGHLAKYPDDHNLPVDQVIYEALILNFPCE